MTNTDIHTYMLTHTLTDTLIHRHTHILRYTYLHIYTHIHMHTQTYMLTYILTYSQIYTYSYMHTHKLTKMLHHQVSCPPAQTHSQPSGWHLAPISCCTPCLAPATLEQPSHTQTSTSNHTSRPPLMLVAAHSHVAAPSTAPPDSHSLPTRCPQSQPHSHQPASLAYHPSHGGHGVSPHLPWDGPVGRSVRMID